MISPRIVFLLTIANVHCALVYNNTMDVDLHNFFEVFVQKFKNYQIIFHSDNSSINLVNNIIRVMDNSLSYSTSLVYNHDTLLDMEYYRPNVSRVLSLIFSRNLNFWNKLSASNKINSRDVVAFVSRGDDLKDNIVEDGLELIKLAGNILLIEKNFNGISIYKTCYYCGSNSKKFQLLETTNNSKIETNEKQLLSNSFRDLNGHLIHVVFVQYFPFIYCKTNGTFQLPDRLLPVCEEIRGIESDFMITMSKKLNFSFVVHLLDPSQSFFNMIQYVNRHKADIAFGGISVTADRMPLVRFSIQYNFEDYHFLYVLSLTFTEIFDKFLEPFRNLLVWALYIISFILLSVSVYVAIKIKYEPNYKVFTLEYSFWTLSHFFFEQSHPDIGAVFRSRFSVGMLLGLWWMVCLLLCNFYKSSVLSTMVQPPNAEPDDIEQLVRAGYRFAGSIQYADIIKDLLHVPDPLYAEALRKTFFGEDACDVLNKILPGHVAMLDEYSELQFELRTICKFPSGDIIDKFRIARKAVRSSGHGWAIQLGAPYGSAIDYYMSLVLSAGLFKKWTANVTGKLAASLIPKSREIKSNDVNPLSLQRISPLFTIYSIGMCVSILCFIIEMLVFYIKKVVSNRKNNNKFNVRYLFGILISCFAPKPSV